MKRPNRALACASFISMLGLGTSLWPHRAEAACGGAQDNCSGGPARIMLIVDASSDVLNEGMDPAGMGASLWDHLGSFLSAPARSPYETLVDSGPMDPVSSQVVHFGLTVVGGPDPAPGEQKVAVDFGPCTKPNVSWAMSPPISCADPGCTDPWGGPPIQWTFVDGAATDPPGFVTPTISHMPRCNDGPGRGCNGSALHIDLAVDLVTDHLAAYRSATDYKLSDSTPFANILFVTGEYDGDDATAQAALQRAFDAGITTYVVGFGPNAANPSMTFSQQLDQMASWGAGGAPAAARIAADDNQLFDEVQAIVDGLALPCCARIDCSSVGGAGDDGGATGGEDANDSWGSASGSGSASDSADTAVSDGMGSASASGSGSGDTDDGAGLDDDGGCTCRARGGTPSDLAWIALPLLVGLRRRGRRHR